MSKAVRSGGHRIKRPLHPIYLVTNLDIQTKQTIQKKKKTEKKDKKSSEGD